MADKKPWERDWGGEKEVTRKPWETYAEQSTPEVQREAPATTQSQPVQPPDDILHRAASGLRSNLPAPLAEGAIGVAKGAAGTLANLGGMASKIYSPDPQSSQEAVDYLRGISHPHGMAQSVGRGIEQAGEFMAPGLGEERAVAALPAATARYAPIARIGYNALTSGAVNRAQGGGFGAGAAMGGAGSAAAEGLRAAAPIMAETAFSFPKKSRGFGREYGERLLSIPGVRPSTIAENAGKRIEEVGGRVQSMAREASVRPKPRIAGRLMAPEVEIPLAGRGPRASTRGGLFSAEESPTWIGGEGEIVPAMNAAGLDRYGVPNPRYLSGSEHPELSGNVVGSKGVLLRRGGDEMPQLDEFGRVVHPRPMEVPYSPFEPNASASLAPARGVISRAQASSIAQNAGKTHGQLEPAENFLNRRFTTGESIPENITPEELYHLRTGFGNDIVGNWNPEFTAKTNSINRSAYRALADEFHRVVPESVPLDRELTELIPIRSRAESLDRGAGLAERMAHRVSAHTGAMASSAAIGAGLGALAHGPVGGLVGTGTGLLLNEAMASPTVRMAAAKGLHYGSRPIAKAAVAGTRQIVGNREK